MDGDTNRSIRHLTEWRYRATRQKREAHGILPVILRGHWTRYTTISTMSIMKEFSTMRWPIGRRDWNAPNLVVGRLIWEEIIRELRRRSDGRRESGAFLLGHKNHRHRQVHRAVFFDDLGARLSPKSIYLDSRGYGCLWQICQHDGISVVADVHTHPSHCVVQSAVDRDNPMIAQNGHLALIIPYYAQDINQGHEIGIYEFLGVDGWRTWPAERVLPVWR